MVYPRQFARVLNAAAGVMHPCEGVRVRHGGCGGGLRVAMAVRGRIMEPRDGCRRVPSLHFGQCYSCLKCSKGVLWHYGKFF